MAAKRVLIGKIATVHGIRGDLKIMALGDHPELIHSKAGVFTGETGDARLFLTSKSQIKHNMYIMSAKGLTDRNEAEKLRGTNLYVNREDLPELDSDDGFYYADLEGLKVVTADGRTLGTVIKMENFGAGDLIDIRGSDGKNFFLPFSDACVQDVNLETGTITVEEPEVI